MVIKGGSYRAGQRDAHVEAAGGHRLHRSAKVIDGPRDEAAEHVHLRRADTGEELEDVFLPFDPELWDASRTRLTVLLDPARSTRSGSARTASSAGGRRT